MELKQEHSKVRKAATDSQYTLLDTLDANHVLTNLLPVSRYWLDLMFLLDDDD